MKFFRAVIAGILGALTMSVTMFILRLAGINVNLEALLGSMFPPPAGISPWALGIIIHFTVGIVAAIGYAALFEVAVQKSGPVVGAGLGLCHGLLAGLLMSGIPAMNPLTLDMSAPRPFLQGLSYGPFVFILLHILFGAVVGTAYGPPLQKPHLYTNPTA